MAWAVLLQAHKSVLDVLAAHYDWSFGVGHGAGGGNSARAPGVEHSTTEILESHVSYPMLAYFRSQHAGQSWVTALGVVLDAATLAAACVRGAEDQEPYLMYRRGRRAVEEISLRLHVPLTGKSWLNRELFEIAYGRLQHMDLPLSVGCQLELPLGVN